MHVFETCYPIARTREVDAAADDGPVLGRAQAHSVECAVGIHGLHREVAASPSPAAGTIDQYVRSENIAESPAQRRKPPVLGIGIADEAGIVDRAVKCRDIAVALKADHKARSRHMDHVARVQAADESSRRA